MHIVVQEHPRLEEAVHLRKETRLRHLARSFDQGLHLGPLRAGRKTVIEEADDQSSWWQPRGLHSSPTRSLTIQREERTKAKRRLRLKSISKNSWPKGERRRRRAVRRQGGGSEDGLDAS